MNKFVKNFVTELPKSPLPAGSATESEEFTFFVSGPNPLECDKYIIDGEAIVLSTGGKAAIHYGKGKFSYSTDCWAMRPNANDIHGKYLYYFLSSQIDRIDALGFEGSGLRHLRKDFVRNYKVPNFSKPEQSQIAEVLSKVDQAIEQTESLIAKQQRIKAGLMQDLLTRGIDEHGNLRSEETHEFKDSPLGRIPVGWEVKELGTALRQARGFLQTGPFGSQLHAYEYVNEGVPVIMPQDILFGEILEDKIARILESKACELSRHRVQPNDIVFSRRGDLTLAAAIGERERGWVCGTGCFLLRVPNDEINAEWLADVYRHHYVQLQVDTNAVGSTMASLNNGVMERLVIAFPNISEQCEIIVVNGVVDTKLRTLRELLSKLRSLKTALMQDLLTGNVRVTPLLESVEDS